MTGLVALVALGLAVPMAVIVDNDQRAALVSDLEVEAMTTASILASEPESEWQATTEEIAQRTGARVTAISRRPQSLETAMQMGADTVLPLVWGAAIASYPFFGKTSETAGRLLALQGDCSIKELQRRMAEQYGDRSGIERAVTRVMQTQTSWQALTRDETAKRIVKRQAVLIQDEELTAWLIEAAVRYAGKSVSVPSLQSLPVLFPFTLTRPLAYLASNSPDLVLRSEGPSSQFVELKRR